MLSKFEARLTYKPDRLVHHDLAKFNLTRAHVMLASGERVVFFHRITIDRPLVIFAHGNTGNLTRYIHHLELYERLGCSILTFDYPGFGESTGVPSERTLFESLTAVYRYSVDLLGVEPASIVFHGMSLGGAVAVAGAAVLPCRCLIVEASFTSSHDMGRYILRGLPLYRLVPKRFDSRMSIGRVSVPVLFIHGTEDLRVPLAHSEELYGIVKGPKFLYRIAGAGHEDQIAVGGSEYAEIVDSFIRQPERIGEREATRPPLPPRAPRLARS